MRDYILSLKFLIPSGLIIMLVANLIGFKMDYKGFLGNFLAEIFGVALSIIITYAIVERLLKYQRDKENKSMRDFTILSITWEIFFMIEKFGIFIPITAIQSLANSIALDMGLRKGMVSESTIKLLKEFLTILENNNTQLESTIDNTMLSDYIEVIEPNIVTLTDNLIPRALHYSVDSNLKEILIVYDNALSRARTDYPLYKKGNLSLISMFSSVLSVLRSSNTVLTAIYQRRYSKTNKIKDNNLKDRSKKISKNLTIQIEKCKEEHKKYISENGNTNSVKLILVRNELKNVIKEYCSIGEKVLLFENQKWENNLSILSNATFFNFVQLQKLGEIDEFNKNKDDIEKVKDLALEMIELRNQLKLKIYTVIGLDDELNNEIKIFIKLQDKFIDSERTKIKNIKSILQILQISMGN